MSFKKSITIIVLHLILFFHVLYSAAGNNISNYVEKELNPIIIEMIEKVEFNNLFNTVSHLQSYGNRYSWEKQWLAANWIEKSLKNYNVEAFIETYKYEDKLWPNIIATIKGTDKSDQIIMGIAHFDSISDDPKKKVAPGANDNASGVAVLMEIARILQNFPIERTVILCFFSNEETGRPGSKFSAKVFKRDGLNIKAVINLDVLGYNRPESIFQLETVTVTYSLRSRIKAAYRAVKNSLNSLLYGSDVVKIGGRKNSENLGEIVAKVFRQYANVNVKEVVNEKCK